MHCHADGLALNLAPCNTRCLHKSTSSSRYETTTKPSQSFYAALVIHVISKAKFEDLLKYAKLQGSVALA